MNKAFVREDAGGDEDEELSGGETPAVAGQKNYITPAGYARLRAELLQLIDSARPGHILVVDASYTGEQDTHRPEYSQPGLQCLAQPCRDYGRDVNTQGCLDGGWVCNLRPIQGGRRTRRNRIGGDDRFCLGAEHDLTSSGLMLCVSDLPQRIASNDVFPTIGHAAYTDG